MAMAKRFRIKITFSGTFDEEDLWGSTQPTRSEDDVRKLIRLIGGPRMALTTFGQFNFDPIEITEIGGI